MSILNIEIGFRNNWPSCKAYLEHRDIVLKIGTVTAKMGISRNPKIFQVIFYMLFNKNISCNFTLK